jgi:hypothetical protein
MDPVPPGSYMLEVQRPGRGDRDGGKPYSQAIVVARGQPTRTMVNILTGTVKLRVVDAATDKPAPVRMIVVAADEASGKDPKEWRTLPSFQRVELRGGVGELRDFDVGEYCYLLIGNGTKPLTGRIFIGSGVQPQQVLRVESQPRPPGKGPQQGQPKSKGKPPGQPAKGGSQGKD